MSGTNYYNRSTLGRLEITGLISEFFYNLNDSSYPNWDMLKHLLSEFNVNNLSFAGVLPKTFLKEFFRHSVLKDKIEDFSYEHKDLIKSLIISKFSLVPCEHCGHYTRCKYY